MSQQVTKTERAATLAIHDALSGRAGTVQCDGCPEGVRVIPGRPGHRGDCAECARHCQCDRNSGAFDY